MGPVSVKDALELNETLSNDERWTPIDIVKRRLLEARRDDIAENISVAREEFTRGEVRNGFVDDLLRELHE